MAAHIQREEARRSVRPRARQDQVARLAVEPLHHLGADAGAVLVEQLGEAPGEHLGRHQTVHVGGDAPGIVLIAVQHAVGNGGLFEDIKHPGLD